MTRGQATEEKDRATRRTIASGALLLVGLIAGVSLPIVGGEDFLLGGGVWVSPDNRLRTIGGVPCFSDFPGYRTPMERRSVVDLVATEPAWAAAAVALVSALLWYWRWRRAPSAFGRAVGALLSLATAAFLVAATRAATYPCEAAWMFVAPAAFAAAFLVAPAPRDPDAIDPVEAWRLVRRHRKTFPVEPR